MSQVVDLNSAAPPASNQRPVRDIPLWLTALILLLCIGGGGWLVWKYARTNTPEPITIAPGNPRAALVKNWRPADDDSRPVRGPRRSQDDDSDGIKVLTPNRTWRVRAGNAYMHVSINRKNQLEISPNYRSIYTPEQNQMVIMRQRLLQDDAMRDFIKITPDQLTKLRNVPPPEGMKMAADEKQKLTDLFEAYRSAKESKAQEAAEKAVLAALDEISKKRFDQTKAYMVQRVEAIQAAITPEQIRQFNGGPPNKAAATPAPKSAAPPAAAVNTSVKTPVKNPAPPVVAAKTPATKPAASQPVPPKPATPNPG